jgi:hypothetical protein
MPTEQPRAPAPTSSSTGIIGSSGPWPEALGIITLTALGALVVGGAVPRRGELVWLAGFALTFAIRWPHAQAEAAGGAELGPAYAARRVHAGEQNSPDPPALLSAVELARQELEAWRHYYNHFPPYASLGNRTPAEMGTGSSGKTYWGHAPNTVVAITPTDGHRSGPSPYS